jgi:hypothetical protein
MAEHCCDQFANHVNPGFAYGGSGGLECFPDGTWNVTVGGEDTVLANIRFCPFCGTRMARADNMEAGRDAVKRSQRIRVLEVEIERLRKALRDIVSLSHQKFAKARAQQALETRLDEYLT